MQTKLRRLLVPSLLALAAAASAASWAAAQDAAADPAAAVAPPAPVDVAPTDAAPVAAPVEAAPPAAAEATPADAVDSVVGAPPAGMGQVVFWRPGRFVGAALSFSVHEGDKGIGKLGNGSYFVYVGEPGEHTFSIQSEVKDTLTLEVEAGETYYVQQTIGMGVMMGRPHLTPSDQAAFQAKKLKLSKKKPTDLRPKSAS